MASACEGCEPGAEAVIDLAGDVALETADDLLLVESFAGAAFGVGARAGAVAQSAGSASCTSTGSSSTRPQRSIRSVKKRHEATMPCRSSCGSQRSSRGTVLPQPSRGL